MSFESMPNAQGHLFSEKEGAPQDLDNRRCRFLPLGSFVGTVQINHGLREKAPWPVWSGSTRKPVQYMPMSRRRAVQLWHDARRLERQTRQKGKQDGAIGRNGLAVLHAFLFDFINHRTGQLDPTRATIARAANISIRSVDRGLEKLKAAGVLNWIRQCVAEIEDGVYRLRQKASAYFVLAQSHWRGFWQAPEAPPPYPEAWGKTPSLPCPLEMSQAVHAEGGSFAAKIDALTCDPRDNVANGLARLFGLLDARKG
jgi:hypothetical protein